MNHFRKKGNLLINNRMLLFSESGKMSGDPGWSKFLFSIAIIHFWYQGVSQSRNFASNQLSGTETYIDLKIKGQICHILWHRLGIHEICSHKSLWTCSKPFYRNLSDEADGKGHIIDREDFYAFCRQHLKLLPETRRMINRRFYEW